VPQSFGHSISSLLENPLLPSPKSEVDFFGLKSLRVPPPGITARGRFLKVFPARFLTLLAGLPAALFHVERDVMPAECAFNAASSSSSPG